MRTINDTPQMLCDLDFSIAQLRHAYAHLMAGRATRQQEFGRGLIAPEIRRLEKVRTALAAQRIEARRVETTSGSTRSARAGSRSDAPEH